MPVMDEFKEERAKLKDASAKEKLNYFWYYYKWHVIIAAAAVVLLVSLIHDIVTRKDTAFHVAVINHASLTGAAENYTGELADYLGIDTAEEEVVIDSTYRISFSAYSRQSINSSEKLMAQAASGSLDSMISDEESFAQYAQNFFFLDLTSVLSKEEIDSLKPYLYYSETDDGIVPLGVYLDNCTQFLETYRPADNTRSVFGIVANTEHTELAVRFLHFLLQNSAESTFQ